MESQTCPNCGLEHDEGDCSYDREVMWAMWEQVYVRWMPPHCENCALEERLSGGERPEECHGSHV